MKKVIVYWEIAGFLFVSALGTLLHFVFECTGGHIAAALFSAVNESVWEHMKLLFYPMFLFAIIERMAWGKAYENFWYIKLMGILRGMILIPVIYYTYTGILGTSYDWFNIAIFFIAAGAATVLLCCLFCFTPPIRFTCLR